MREDNNKYYEEDEIDLTELVKTIWNRRWFVISFTVLVTLLAIIYAYIKTPIYEAKALIEIGKYKKTINKFIYLDNVTSLSKKLTVLFIDKFKNTQKESKSKIVNINIPKKAKGFLEIKAEGISNKLAQNEIEKVLKYLQSKDKIVLKDIKKTKELEIKHIKMQIDNLKQNEIKFLNEKIELINNDIEKYKKILKSLNKEIQTNKTKSNSTAIFALMEKRDINEKLSELENILIQLNDKRNDLLVNMLNSLLEKKNKLELLLAPYNYTESHIVGEILINDYPAKPKKKLIVIVAFITGFILSIFLVFFIEFIKGLKKEVYENE